MTNPELTPTPETEFERDTVALFNDKERLIYSELKAIRADIAELQKKQNGSRALLRRIGNHSGAFFAGG